MAEKLIDKLVRELAPPGSGNRIVYDVDVKGFGARITAGGARSFILNYRIAGRERRHTIGGFPAWSVRMAREEAAKLKRDIDRGRDPVGEREEARSAPTVAELTDRYLAEHAAPKKNRAPLRRTAQCTAARVTGIGSLRVAAVTRDDIARLHSTMKDSPIGANRVLSLLSKMFSLAEIWGMRSHGSNPCRGIDRYRETGA